MRWIRTTANRLMGRDQLSTPEKALVLYEQGGDVTTIQLDAAQE